MLCYVDRVLCKKRSQGFDKGIEDDKIKAPDTPTLYIHEEEEDIRAKKACAQKISRSLKNFARFVIEVVDAMSEEE